MILFPDLCNNIAIKHHLREWNWHLEYLKHLTVTMIDWKRFCPKLVPSQIYSLPQSPLDYSRIMKTYKIGTKWIMTTMTEMYMKSNALQGKKIKWHVSLARAQMKAQIKVVWSGCYTLDGVVIFSYPSRKQVRVMKTPLHSTLYRKNWGLQGYTFFLFLI